MASKERRAQKPKIEITLQRSANFEEIRSKKQAIVRFFLVVIYVTQWLTGLILG